MPAASNSLMRSMLRSSPIGSVQKAGRESQTPSEHGGRYLALAPARHRPSSVCEETRKLNKCPINGRLPARSPYATDAWGHRWSMSAFARSARH
jgi:hypothetical protein